MVETGYKTDKGLDTIFPGWEVLVLIGRMNVIIWQAKTGEQRLNA